MGKDNAIERAAIQAYLRERFGDIKIVEFEALGTGTHGTGFAVGMTSPEGKKEFVIKKLEPSALGHDYPSDRAAVFLLAYNEYGNLPKHVKPLDVLSLQSDGTVRSISNGKEYFLFMEKAAGVSYFRDIEEMAKKERLTEKDKVKIRAMAEYLHDIHSVKKDSKALYRRKLRDTIGHGECLMGVFDAYPDGVISYEEMAEIEKLCVDWRARLKPYYKRLCRIHGDFHPGNIWFRNGDFILLDRSRGPWGEAADDVTALTINYIFFSVKHSGTVQGAYLEAFKMFFNEYLELTGDEFLLNTLGPFFAFRGVVVSNPVFYPELEQDRRKKIFAFIHTILEKERFEPERVNEYF